MLVEQQARLILSHAFILSASRRSAERAGGALGAIARVLGIRDQAYIEELAEVVHALSV
jgi:hypothetical protein